MVNKKINRYQDNYFNKLMTSIKPKEKEIMNERVKIVDKNIKINENINDMINNIDKMIDE